MQLIGIELGKHGFERDAHAGEDRELMIAQVVEGVGERVDRAEIRGVTLDEEVVQRVFDVGRELERVVLRRTENRLLHPEFFLDLLARLQHVHQSGYDDPKDLS